MTHSGRTIQAPEPAESRVRVPMEALTLVGRGLRWAIAGLVTAGGFWLLIETVRHVPGPLTVPFELWYGNWSAVLRVTALFTIFLFAFARPRRPAEWRNAGLTTAFFISLFTEMFGIPLTIYLLASVVGVPAWVFGHGESHLWALALELLGVVPLHRGVYLVMVLSIGLIALGGSLVVLGWATVYRGRDGLVTSGIYRLLRHPQYLGLILIVVAFNIQWPTLPTLLMGPVLVIMYLRLARREDQELAAVFGEQFLDYAARTPAFLPRGRGRAGAKQG